VKTTFFATAASLALSIGFACASMACSRAAPLPSSTPADVSTSAAAPTTQSDDAETHDAQGAPVGQLVCRAKSVSDGVTELFLDWNGKAASGTLRRKAPSGMVYVQPVHAERHQGLIVVDESNAPDLVSHAAMVVQQDGKLLMRVGDSGQPLSTCE
jgi:hypothetical protein